PPHASFPYTTLFRSLPLPGAARLQGGTPRGSADVAHGCSADARRNVRSRGVLRRPEAAPHWVQGRRRTPRDRTFLLASALLPWRSEEHTSELQSRGH